MITLIILVHPKAEGGLPRIEIGEKRKEQGNTDLQQNRQAFSTPKRGRRDENEKMSCVCCSPWPIKGPGDTKEKVSEMNPAAGAVMGPQTMEKLQKVIGRSKLWFTNLFRLGSSTTRFFKVGPSVKQTSH